MTSLDKELLGRYIRLIKAGKRNLSAMKDEGIYELMSIQRNGRLR